jgi:hypothetical protein
MHKNEVPDFMAEIFVGDYKVEESVAMAMRVETVPRLERSSQVQNGRDIPGAGLAMKKIRSILGANPVWRWGTSKSLVLVFSKG